MRAASLYLVLIFIFLAACTSVDLEAPVPTFDTSVDAESWVTIPAGEFLSGQHNEPVTISYDYEIMVTDVTVTQYVSFLNDALTAGKIQAAGEAIVGYYPGDEYNGVKHEVEIPPADYIFVPLNDPASRFSYDGLSFNVKSGYETHPMTNVSWFGAWGFCGYNSFRLPMELEWEKAARGSIDSRPFPWGEEIARNNANFYASQDPFEDMSSYGSRTTPVGFYNGQAYDGYQTLASASPYGLYDMAGNVWQWTADIYEGVHYRTMRGGSKGNYEYNLRVWSRNSAEPDYAGPSTGFRCAR